MLDTVNNGSLSMVDVAVRWLSSEGSLDGTRVSPMGRSGRSLSLSGRCSFSNCGIVAGHLCQRRSSSR